MLSFLLAHVLLITQTYSQLDTFEARVCNKTGFRFYDYDDCSCKLAKWSIEKENATTCFNQFICPYDAATNQFCSGNGFCDFQSGSCVCDREYGASDCSEQYTQFLPPSWVLILMIIFASIGLLVSLGLMGWVHIYREVGEVKAMSVVFTHLTLVGTALISAGTIVIGVGYNNANCVILEWLQFLGICIVIGCALLKAYRIACIFGASDFSPLDLTDNRLLTYFAIMIVIDMLFLTVYTIFNFVEGGSYERYLEEELYKETRCSSEPLTMVSYSLLVAWQLVLLLFVLKYGNDTRSASKVFKETKCIYIGSNIGAICFIAFGIFVMFTTNYTLQIVIRGYGSMLVVLMVIWLLFYPKIQAVWLMRKQEKDPNHGMVEDEHGNKLTEGELELKRQYEAHVKDPNGKELLLLLEALVREISYRSNHNMLSIELKDIDLVTLLKLSNDVQNLIPKEMREEYLKHVQEHGQTAGGPSSNDSKPTNGNKELQQTETHILVNNTSDKPQVSEAVSPDVADDEEDDAKEVEMYRQNTKGADVAEPDINRPQSVQSVQSHTHSHRQSVIDSAAAMNDAEVEGDDEEEIMAGVTAGALNEVIDNMD